MSKLGAFLIILIFPPILIVVWICKENFSSEYSQDFTIGV